MRRRIRDLEAQLRDAKQELRGGDEDATPAAGGYDAKTVRAWAAANDVDCPDRGRIPQPVLAAWAARQVAS